MHTSAKHYFEVVWTHLDAFRAVKSRSALIFHGFAGVLGAQAGPAGPEPPEASRAAGEQSLSEDFEEFISSGQGFGRFYKLRARIWKIL